MLGLLLASAAVTAPATGASASASAEPTSGLEYVALGDSYSAGFGIEPHTNLPAPGCYQAEQNYPHLVAAELGLSLTDVTCSGAVTENITTTPQITMTGSTAPLQSDALSAETDIVTVTIGGNDLGFSVIAESCLAAGPTGPLLSDEPDCRSLYVQDGFDILAARIADEVAPAVLAAFTDIATKAPNAEIFVVGYPAIAPSAADTPAAGCFSSLLNETPPPAFTENAYPFTDIDVPYLHKIERLLDEAIRAQADAVGATFLPTFELTSAHSPCAPEGEAYVNGITLESYNPATPPEDDEMQLRLGALHPNAAGVGFLHTTVADAIRAADLPGDPTAPDPDETSGPGAPGADDAESSQDSLAESGAAGAFGWAASALLALALGATLIITWRSRETNRD
ncbi:SGNH/GDSL hydrolase family protein [Okibacterium endophyticum]